MAFDFKKEYRALYLPKTKPALVDVPDMTYVAVAGTGNPNDKDGAYARSVGLLYGFSYTLKMSKMGSWQPEGYFDFVVPPLEGLWWAGAGAFEGAEIAEKTVLSWVSLIRQPDFVTPEVFSQVCEALVAKKPEFAPAVERGDLRLVRFAEGPCAQVMHRGPYDAEAATVAELTAFIEAQGLVTDISAGGESPLGDPATRAFDAEEALAALDAAGGVPSLRLHHEIYLGDPRRTKPENLRTVIRHPVRPR